MLALQILNVAIVCPHVVGDKIPFVSAAIIHLCYVESCEDDLEYLCIGEKEEGC